MTRFLAIVRRIFWGGTISLLLCIFLFNTGFKTMLNLAIEHNSLQGIFSIFFLLSPILFLLFTIISVAYIRKNGQFAAVHQSQSPVTSFFRCWGHDIIAPFKNIGNFFPTLFNKNAMGRGILIGRFIEMLVLIAVCAIGILLLMN